MSIPLSGSRKTPLAKDEAARFGRPGSGDHRRKPGDASINLATVGRLVDQQLEHDLGHRVGRGRDRLGGVPGRIGLRVGGHHRCQVHDGVRPGHQLVEGRGRIRQVDLDPMAPIVATNPTGCRWLPLARLSGRQTRRCR